MGSEESGNLLSTLFEKCLATFDELENGKLSSSDKEFQNILNKGISHCEEATKLVNALSLFSSNESFEEIPTADIKYLLLPVFLGKLTNQLLSEDKQELLKIVKVYYSDFFERCKSYEIPEMPLPKPKSKDVSQLRTQKIADYKRLKALEENEQNLKHCLTKHNVADEDVREYYLVLIQLWGVRACEDMRSAEDEYELLERFKKTPTEKLPPVPSASKLKPFILTKTKLQKEVYGAGYPSLPIYTIEDWYKMRYEGTGELEHHAGTTERPPEKEEPEEETPETIGHARAFDDWKDDNRRGSGNRHNMG